MNRGVLASGMGWVFIKVADIPLSYALERLAVGIIELAHWLRRNIHIGQR